MNRFCLCWKFNLNFSLNFGVNFFLNFAAARQMDLPPYIVFKCFRKSRVR